LVLLVLVVSALAHEHTFNCIFDKENKDMRAQAARYPQPEFMVQPGVPSHGRLLTPTTSYYGAMRI
jgi:hypothetical protein